MPKDFGVSVQHFPHLAVECITDIDRHRNSVLLMKARFAFPSMILILILSIQGNLFGKPARPKTAQAKVEENQSVLYGRSHEFLLPDIHREKGMHCIDCHGHDSGEAEGGLMLDSLAAMVAGD